MTLFLASTSIEFRGFLKRCTEVRREELPVNWACSGLFQGSPMLAVANGAGIERAYAAVGGPDLQTVCNIGFCGALHPALRIGDIVVPKQVGTEKVREWNGPRPAMEGTLHTSRYVVRRAAEKQALHNDGAIAVDMEAAGALRRARELNVPFYAIKCVSDLASEDLHCDYNRALRDDGSVSFSRLAVDAVARPFTCLPELLRFGRRASVAAERLGEFLAASRL